MVEDEKILAFDLRQKYAQIAGIHLEDVTISKKSKNFPAYFQALEDLYTVVQHKFKKNKKGERSDEDIYKELKTKAIEIANKYPNTFTGITQDPKQIHEIKEALGSMEMFFYRVMDKANMFGSNWENDGL